MQMKSYSTEGIAGLYRGFSVAFWGSAPGTCLYLTSYQVVKERLVLIPGMEKRNFLAHFSAGMLAETIR